MKRFLITTLTLLFAVGAVAASAAWAQAPTTPPAKTDTAKPEEKTEKKPHKKMEKKAEKKGEMKKAEKKPATKEAKKEPVHPVHAPEDRVPVAAIAVEGAVAARECRPLHRRDATGQDLGAHRRRLGREGQRPVGVEVPVLARHADDREDPALRSEIAPLDVVDENHVR